MVSRKKLVWGVLVALSVFGVAGFFYFLVAVRLVLEISLG